MSNVGQSISTVADASGNIIITLFQRQAPDLQEHFDDFEVGVSPDMVAIGGGVIGGEGPPGALVTASYPNMDLTSWFVSTKDHESPQSYQVTAYALGMIIRGMGRDQLFDSIKVTTANSGVFPHPVAEAGIPDDSFLLVSGGFKD